MTESTVEEWAKRAARAAVDKKADDPVVLFVGGVLAITDYFVIVSGANSRQVRTIADAVEEELGRDGGPKPLRVEGLNDLTWVLIDYGDLVVHVSSTSASTTRAALGDVRPRGPSPCDRGHLLAAALAFAFAGRRLRSSNAAGAPSSASDITSSSAAPPRRGALVPGSSAATSSKDGGTMPGCQ